MASERAHMWLYSPHLAYPLTGAHLWRPLLSLNLLGSGLNHRCKACCLRYARAGRCYCWKGPLSDWIVHLCQSQPAAGNYR